MAIEAPPSKSNIIAYPWFTYTSASKSYYIASEYYRLKYNSTSMVHIYTIDIRASKYYAPQNITKQVYHMRLLISQFN